MTRLCVPLILATVLAACGSREEPAPAAAAEQEEESTGTAELEFLGLLAAGGQFRLSNGTSAPIAFASTHEDSDGPHARDARLSCQAAGSEQWDEGPQMMSDSEVSTIEVAPGAEQTLAVMWEPGVVEHYAGGRCRVDLTLEGGSVESAAFSF